MKPYKPNTKYNSNEVDTGFIYTELIRKKDDYPEDVVRRFRSTLIILLTHRNIKTIPNNEETVEYIKILMKNLNDESHAIVTGKMKETDPRLEYFAFQDYEDLLEGNDKYYITVYKESCISHPGEKYYDWDSYNEYFALKLNLTGLLEIDSFLNHQLEIYFKDINSFKRYLELIIIKYQSQFLTKEVIQIISEWTPKIEFSQNNTLLEWKGTNGTEFVQFAYALQESGLLKHSTGEIGKLVESLAIAFNFKLSKHWQSDFGKSINNRNSEYEPKIFDNLKKVYKEYVDKRLNSKK